LNYRADIDGLRAIAVLSVVLFHLDLPFFSGGYVGVDIFFVISGYLITSIIKHKYENQDFRLSDFYARRIRRLLPPLIATVAATLLGAALVMTPYDMVAFARSAAAALFSLSNIVFYLESGYWDTASELKPLLHTWSLGVEEQFYLFWPLLIIGLLSIRRSVPLGLSLAVISVLGAILCIWFTGIDQSAAFYLLPFRVFQFAVGALLIPIAAVLRDRSGNRHHGCLALAFWTGVVCIAASVVLFDGDTRFPGWAVLLPTSGAALVLLHAATSSALSAPARQLMENRLSVWVGKVSYSMYLVHWPIIALFRYAFGPELTSSTRLGLAAATLAATVALHYGIERRFYHRAGSKGHRPGESTGAQFAVRTLAVAGLLALLATSAWQGDGWAWRYPSLSLSAQQITQGEEKRFTHLPRACSLGNPLAKENCNFAAQSQILVLGNSTEVDAYNFIRAGYGGDQNLNLILFGGVEGCSFYLESDRVATRNERCQKRLELLFDPAMTDRLDAIVYSANRPYADDKAHFLAMLKRLTSANPDIRIITMGGYLKTDRPCAYYINQTNTTDACARPENITHFDDNPRSEGLFEQFSALESHYIDRVELLCKNRVPQTCKTRTDDGVPAFYDRLHNSLEFAEMSGKLYAQRHPDLLQQVSRPE
jgi:peptidoglycan/LPS O-acetylase OafA/YrhL